MDDPPRGGRRSAATRTQQARAAKGALAPTSAKQPQRSEDLKAAEGIILTSPSG